MQATEQEFVLHVKNGEIICIYADELRPVLQAAGTMQINRASHVEPNDAGEWTADLSPVAGPTLGAFDTRAEALAAEVQWLKENYI